MDQNIDSIGSGNDELSSADSMSENGIGYPAMTSDETAISVSPAEDDSFRDAAANDGAPAESGSPVAELVKAIVGDQERHRQEENQSSQEARRILAQTTEAQHLLQWLVDNLDDADLTVPPFLAGPGCYVDATGVYQRPLATGVKTQRYGKTDDALEKDGKVTVSLWTYDKDEEEWSDTGEDQEDVYDSFCYQCLTLPAGVMVKIRHNPENSRWEIVEVPPLVGKTDAALDEDGSVTVSIWDHAGSSWSDSGRNIEDVYDSFFLQGLTLPTGAYVKIRWSVDNKRWEIVEVTRFNGTLQASLTTGGSANAQVNGGTLSVHAPNVQTDTISSGKKIKAAWESQNMQWEVDGRECE